MNDTTMSRLIDDVKEGERYALSDTDIKRYMNNNISIILYNDLYKMSDIRDLFKESLNVMLLYPVDSYNSGHWVTMWYQPRDHSGREVLHYFDPYALGIHRGIQKSTYLADKSSKYTLIHLVNAFKVRGGIVYTNTMRHQVMSGAISTCGRHCLVRLICKRMTHAEYDKYLIYPGLNGDQLVTLITLDTISNIMQR